MYARPKQRSLKEPRIDPPLGQDVLRIVLRTVGFFASNFGGHISQCNIGLVKYTAKYEKRGLLHRTETK